MTIPDSLNLLRDLVAFPTVSRDSNLDLIDYVRRFLSGFGIASTLVPSEDGRKANLFAVVGPSDRSGIVLSGHTDVVPVAGQAWSRDPFDLHVADGYAIGRGSVDMKAFVACMLRSAALAAGRTLARPLVLAFSHDEEVGCVGVRRMLPLLGRLPHRPSVAVIGEPTGMRLVLGHKGKIMGRVVCRGVAGHSNDPDGGVNAIEMAGEVMAVFARHRARARARAERDATFTVPFTTLHVGTIRGGTSLNTIPDLCEVSFEVRLLPHDDADAVLAALRTDCELISAPHRAVHPGAGIDVLVDNDYPGLATGADQEAVVRLRALLDTPDGDRVSYGTEAGLFARDLGIPAVVCGPGDVAEAHRADERVTLSQIAACDRFLAHIVDDLAW